MEAEEESGATLWIVIPIGWGYDDQNYNVQGYSLPNHCFTLREMAEEWARENTLSFFRSIASEVNFSGYVSENTIRYSIIWDKYSEFWAAKSKKSNFYQNYSGGDDHFFQEVYENFCKFWNIIPEDFRIETDTLNKMSDEKIVALLKELDLEFFKVHPAKILC